MDVHVAAELQHTEDEDARFAAELQRAEDEDARFAAELQRTEDEDARFASELQRTEDGDARFAAELQRAEDEDARFAAELQRAEDEDARFAAELQYTDEEGALFAAELQRAEEEMLTYSALRGVQQFMVEASIGSDGAILLGSQRYRRVECGSVYGTQRNLCWYLALSLGDGESAAALKRRIAPLATQISAQQGAGTDFMGEEVPADEEVIRAYVLLERAPVCVFSEATGAAVMYRNDACDRECFYLHLQNNGGYGAAGHYQRLLQVLS